jgi:hypothetical protein
MVILARKLKRKVSHREILFSDKVKKKLWNQHMPGVFGDLKKATGFSCL